MLSPGEVAGRAYEAARFLKGALALDEVSTTAVVLGSGWDALLEGIGSSKSVGFESIPGFASAGVDGHRGSLRVVETGNGRLLVQEGRLHCYEGFSPLEVSFPVWVYNALGVEVLIMLSAAGGLNPAFLPGDLMIISDHIFLWGPNPLVGVPDKPGRPRFLHGHGLYHKFLQDALQSCLPEGTRVERGTYVFVTGPSFETPAEAQLLRLAGADAVGMSTAPEALTARYLGMEVAAMVCISNSLLPASGAPASHDMVLEVVRRVAVGLPGLLDGLAATARPGI